MENYPCRSVLDYPDPKTRVEMPLRKRDPQAKTLCVMCTYIPKTAYAKYTTRSFGTDEIRAYCHDRFECLKFTLAAHKHWDPGMPCDLIIVDNSSPHLEAVEYMRDGNCKLLFYSRQNTFFSFGAYIWAYENFGSEYDYFVFHEMDWVPSNHNWLKGLIDFWVSDHTIGMIGNLIETRGSNYPAVNDNQKTNNEFIEKIAPHRTQMWNLDSEYLFTNRFVIEQMLKNGGWQVYPCVPVTDLAATFNELAFQQPILEMGYKIASYNDGEHTMFYATYNNGFVDKWNHGMDKLAPFVPEQTRFFVPEMATHFDFYDHKKNNSFVEFL